MHAEFERNENIKSKNLYLVFNFSRELLHPFLRLSRVSFFVVFPVD